MQFLHLLSTGLLQLFAVAVLSLFSGQKFGAGSRKPVLLFCLLFLLDTVLASLLNMDLFAGQQWNWAGKSASVVWALLFIYTTTLLSKKDMGWAWKIEQRKGVFAIVAFLLTARLALWFWFQGFGGGYNLETALFEATLPGLSEELVYRGILLGLLNKIFPVKWKLINTRFGWGLILTSVLFGLVHGLSMNERWIVGFSSQRFFMTGALGFALGFVKEKAKNLAPTVLLHNLWNLIAFWGR